MITKKGTVGADISTSDAIVTTELLFSGILNDLDCAQTVALISCLLFNEKNDETIVLKKELDPPFQKLK